MPLEEGSNSRTSLEVATAALLSLASGTEKKKPHSDLLPLPLEWSEEDEAWDEKASDP